MVRVYVNKIYSFVKVIVSSVISLRINI